MGISKIKESVQDLKKTFEKRRQKSYLLGFLYDENEEKQQQIINLTFQLYYRDELNPFAQLVPQLVKSKLIGPYPDAVIEEVKYLKTAETERKLLIKAKEEKKDLYKYIRSEEFNSEINRVAKEVEDELLSNHKKLHYILVTTDDAEYQDELDKMSLDENAVKIKDQKLKIVLSIFNA